jgi:hypothetical protein
MNINVDGRATPVAEVMRLSGVDIFNPDSAIGSTLTLENRMHGKMILFSAACTVTVPTGLRPDFSCGWSQDGAGAVTFEAGAGVTIQSLSDLLDSGGQYAVGGIAAFSSMIADSATVFRLYGPLA